LREPLYKHVYNSILADILSRVYKPGKRLPNLDQLATQHGVSLTTIRQAIRILREQGLVELWPRRGTFVRASLTERVGADLAGFSTDIAKDAEHLTVKTLLYEQVLPEGWVKKTLASVMRRDLVTHVRRLHFVNCEPVITSDYYLPLELDQKALETSDDWPYFRAFLAKVYGVLPVKVLSELQAIPASPQIAELLRLPPGSPVLYARKTSFDVFELPCECHTVYARTERWRYRATSSLSSEG